MRKINKIIVHCSATEAGHDYKAADIDKWHKQRGFAGIGYHYVIDLDGTLEEGRDIEKCGAHCMGHNKDSIGICYIGGLENNKPKDTRTQAQKTTLKLLISLLRALYNITEVKGHRDYSPDLNGDGTISPGERIKECPCFDVEKEY